MAERAWYLHCGPEDVGDRAVLVGDRGRVTLAAKLLGDVAWQNEDRGLATLTGTWAGQRITVSAFGMGAPIAAIVLHELANLGVASFVRLGTVLALPPAQLGDLVLADGAVRGESTGTTYLPLEWPAVPDQQLRAALGERAQRLPRRAISGLFASYDGFYTQMLGGEPVRLEGLARHGVVAVDMETSAILVAARALGVRAASLCLATVDGLTREQLERSERLDAERDLLVAGLDALTEPNGKAAPSP